jgi:hypothetical protein
MAEARTIPEFGCFLTESARAPGPLSPVSVLVGYRPARTGGLPARRSAHRRPGSERCLSRRPGMPPGCAGRATGDCRHGVRILVRVCAPARRSSRRPRRRALGSGRTEPARHPGAGRNVMTWIRPACSVVEARGSHLRYPDVRTAAVPAQMPRSAAGCDSLTGFARTLPGSHPLTCRNRPPTRFWTGSQRPMTPPGLRPNGASCRGPDAPVLPWTRLLPDPTEEGSGEEKSGQGRGQGPVSAPELLSRRRVAAREPGAGVPRAGAGKTRA